MTEDELQVAVDELAEALQRSVVINDPGVHLLYSSAHFGDEDPVRVRAMLRRDAGPKAIGHVLAQGVSTWTTAGIIPPNPYIGMKARVCVPIRWRGDLLGLLIVMDADGSLTTSELAAINETARGLGPAMAMRDRGDPDVAAHEHLVLDLVSREPALRRRALSDLGASTDLDHFETVTAIEVGLASGSGGQGSSPAPAHVTMALRGALRLKPPAATAVLHAVGEGTALLLLGAATSVAEEVATAHATRLVEQVTDLAAGRFASVAGIGPRVTGLDQAVESATQARLARRAAGSVLAVPVASWAELGAYGPLLRIPAEQLTELALPAQLRRVLEIDRERQLTDTLRAYLDSGCLAPAAAKTLHIHRTTLYYRLGRITDLTGLDLTDGRTRLELHLGLAMLDLIDHDLRH